MSAIDERDIIIDLLSAHEQDLEDRVYILAEQLAVYREMFSVAMQQLSDRERELTIARRTATRLRREIATYIFTTRARVA